MLIKIALSILNPGSSNTAACSGPMLPHIKKKNPHRAGLQYVVLRQLFWHAGYTPTNCPLTLQWHHPKVNVLLPCVMSLTLLYCLYLDFLLSAVASGNQRLYTSVYLGIEFLFFWRADTCRGQTQLCFLRITEYILPLKRKYIQKKWRGRHE